MDISVLKCTEIMKATAIGDMSLKECNLNEVLQVLELSTNLLSIRQVIKNEGKVVFEEDKVTVLWRNKQVLTGKVTDNELYTIKLSNEEKEVHLTET